MSCLINKGYVLGCKDSTGGVRNVYLANFSGATTFTVDGSDVITAITSSPSFYKYECPKQTAGVVETATVNVQNGTVLYSQVLTLVLNKMSADMRNEMMLLAKAPLFVIAEDQNGLFWLLGKQNAVDLTTGTSGTGTNFGDRNGYSLTFTALEPASISNITYASFSANIAG